MRLSESSTCSEFSVTSPYSRQLSRRALLRSQILRATSNNSPVPPSYYKSLSASLWHAFHTGAYLKDGSPKDSDAPTTPPNPLSNPEQMEGMMDGMKKQLVMMVPQMVIMGWINFFFQGFVASESCVARVAAHANVSEQSSFLSP